jgi:hypothetical protein
MEKMDDQFESNSRERLVGKLPNITKPREERLLGNLMNNLRDRDTVTQ